MQDAIDRIEREKKRQAKKTREQEKQKELAKKKSFIASTANYENDDELRLARKDWEAI